jgi:hypothetical protein
MKTATAALIVVLLAGVSVGEEEKPSFPLVGPSLEGAAVWQPEVDIDEGGKFRVNRYFIQPGVDAFLSRGFQLSVNLGYAFDDYEFEGLETEPWDDVESLRLSVFTRYELNEEWTLFGLPTVRWSAERGADLSDGTTYGFLGGASWKAGENLTIGPGFGVFSELEDDPVFFPILLIDWKFADRWSLRTGRGLAASRGPGLILGWDFADDWAVELGGRWEQFRFRLDGDEEAGTKDGVGEEESIPVFLALTWKPTKRSAVSLLGGVNLRGRLKVFDDRGDELASESYDPAPFLGVAFTLRF